MAGALAAPGKAVLMGRITPAVAGGNRGGAFVLMGKDAVAALPVAMSRGTLGK